jgi:phage gpG-like protein
MITIGVEGQERLERALTGAASDISDYRPHWRAISDEVYSITRNQFATEGGRAGTRWPKRAESTLDRLTSLNRKGFSSLALPLRSTDALFNAVTTRNAPHGIYEERSDSLTLGTSLEYAGYHQTVTRRMPARKIYDLTENDGKRLLSIIKRGLREKIKDRGFDFVESGEIPF